MAEPFRRRIREKLLRFASASSVVLPQPVVLGGLQSAAWFSRFSAFEETTRSNLRLAYNDELSEDELQDIASGVRRHLARLSYEWLQLGAIGDERDTWLSARVQVDDSLEILQREIAKGRGAIVVTAHIGNWELLAATLARVGFKGSVVGLEKRKDPSAAWLIKMRKSYKVETIPQHSSPRALVRVLQEGQVLGLLCDLEVRRLGGEFLPFFGTQALTMTAPAALARTRGLPLIPVRCVLPREGASAYRLIVSEPLRYNHSLPRKQAMLGLMTELNAVYEEWIRESPMQWAWHQKRWRTRPGELVATPLAGR
ncbi:MAG: KDO2-lipid IV(A) lauroyltransferase [Planctomycetota bacterium]|jgi:KDO2-lipid IV(A) lauroyltransferase